MFDYQVSKQQLLDSACRQFAQNHNLSELAEKVGMRSQVLRNKLNPEQPHQLTLADVLALTDLTEDASLVDGLLAQLNCLPSVPVNELSADNLPNYVLHATAAVGQMAAGAVSGERMTQSRKNAFVNSVNSGIRCLTLAAMAVHTRIHSNPAMASTADVIGGISASIGLS
ncbi:phage regulatory CII family protein [Erwinia aphidicola]|uniref:phage regulatory CII family protein n=1 Tax=Erwinia aphidicola TaxID=68334 RepID=UPI0030194670